jgi:hypothetical protein
MAAFVTIESEGEVSASKNALTGFPFDGSTGNV